MAEAGHDPCKKSLHSAYTDSLCRLRHSPPNSSELFQMQEVMPRIQSNHMLDAFGAALGVNPDALEVFIRRARQQSQIRPAKRAEILQRLIGVSFAIAMPLGPQVLVIAGQRGAVMRQGHAEPITPDERRIGQMLQDMPDRPLSGGLGLRDLLRG